MWSKVKVKKAITIEEKELAHFYYIIKANLLIPDLPNAQEVLQAYLENNKDYHLPFFIDQYPKCTNEQRKTIFKDWDTLGVQVTLHNHTYNAPITPPIIVLDTGNF